MNTLQHILINATGAAIISVLTLGHVDMHFFWVVVLAGVLIDADHTIAAMYSGMIKSPIKLVRYWVRIANRRAQDFYIFHTFEFIFLLVLLGIMFNNLTLLFVVVGLLLHLMADCVASFRSTGKFNLITDYSLITILFFIRR